MESTASRGSSPRLTPGVYLNDLPLKYSRRSTPNSERGRSAAGKSNDPASNRSVYAPVASSTSLRRNAIWIRSAPSWDTGRNSATPSLRPQHPTISQA